LDNQEEPEINVTNQVWNKINHFAQSAAHRIRVRSALNPILWLCAIATPMCFFAAYQFRSTETICVFLIVGALTPILVACLCFIGFAIFKPEKLQSEDYQIRHETLQIIQQKSGHLALDPTSLEAIANPAPKLLEEGGNEE
jgi:hypothetical protein